MDKWSKKYKQWFRLTKENQHPFYDKIYRIKNYWYRPDKDMMIHNDKIEDYITLCLKAKDYYKSKERFVERLMNKKEN